MSVQASFPQMFDPNCLRPRQLVRVRDDADTTLRGILAILAEVGDDYVSALVLVSGEDPRVVTLPRESVERLHR